MDLAEANERLKTCSWICYECAMDLGGYTSEGDVSTFHYDICGICKQRKVCTEPRDYRL